MIHGHTEIERRQCVERANGAQWRALIGASALLSLWVYSQPVRADMVLVSQTDLVMGSLSQSLELTAPSAGTVDVTLSDLAWPERLSSLSFSATTGASVLQSGSLSGSSTSYQTTFSLTGPDAFYAHVAAVAQSLGVAGAPALGLYSLRIGFTPEGAPVPLPASGWLLLVDLVAAVVLGRIMNRPHPSHAGALPAAGN